MEKIKCIFVIVFIIKKEKMHIQKNFMHLWRDIVTENTVRKLFICFKNGKLDLGLGRSRNSDRSSINLIKN